MQIEGLLLNPVFPVFITWRGICLPGELVFLPQEKVQIS